MTHFVPILIVLVAGACATTPAAPPGEVVGAIVAALDEDRPGDAERFFARAARRKNFAEKLYPLLYSEAEGRHAGMNASGSAEILKFMLSRYPTATAVPEALLYCLFLQRAGQDEPDPALLDEIDSVLRELSARGESAARWVDLVAAQQAIDRQALQQARAAYARFLTDWDGQPRELLIYVEDLERYVASH